ncbi:O-antigen ligase family protein, partial [Halorubrum trueperi]
SLIAGITGIVLVSIGTVLRSKLNRLSTIPRIGVLTYAGIALASFLIPLLFNNPFSIPDQGSLHTRYRLLEIGVRNAAEYPLGTGLGGFPEVIANSPLRPERVRTPHSWAIQLLVELGVPGVLLFICLFGRVTDQLLYQTICGDNWMALPLATILLITPVSSIGPSESLYMPELWLVLALGLIYQIRSTQGWPGE